MLQQRLYFLPLPHGQSPLRPILRGATGAAAAALDLPLSLHTATRRQGRTRGAGDKTLRDASSRASAVTPAHGRGLMAPSALLQPCRSPCFTQSAFRALCLQPPTRSHGRFDT
jgi:hypothetical protein